MLRYYVKGKDWCFDDVRIGRGYRMGGAFTGSVVIGGQPHGLVGSVVKRGGEEISVTWRPRGVGF